ncbi:MAG: glycine oxidase ThiO [Candidatus Omnitrophica bacterium]|nr:glycine oxidase ThiO [Candidatus Omnitrophota bacterium]
MSRTDVLILGGGIIGCALAEELGRHGQRVAVLERGRIGAEASSAAAGILVSQTDVSHPGPLFDLCQAARRMYPRWIEHLERRTVMSVGYHVDGVLYLAMRGQDESSMKRQAKWQTRQGLRVDRWSPKEVRQHEPSVDGNIRCGFYFPTEAQVDNAVLMQALTTACRKAGVVLHETTSVRRVLVKDGTARGVDTDQGTFEAPVIVNCLGSWGALDKTFPTPVPVQPARGQMLVFLGPKRLFRHAIMSSEGAYVVQRRDGRLLLGSTVEFVGFTKALTVDGMHTILSRVRHMSSAVTACTFVESWSGLRPHTEDLLPILGSTTVDGLYVATGHFRHGILLAPITAHLMAELILRGRASIDLTPFSPQRFR